MEGSVPVVSPWTHDPPLSTGRREGLGSSSPYLTRQGSREEGPSPWVHRVTGTHAPGTREG